MPGDSLAQHGRAEVLAHARDVAAGEQKGVEGWSRISQGQSGDPGGDIRAWAKAADIAVSDRGRIPASVAEQYQASATRC